MYQDKAHAVSRVFNNFFLHVLWAWFRFQQAELHTNILITYSDWQYVGVILH